MSSATANLDLASGFPNPSYDQWKALVDKALKGADFEKRLVTRTADGIAIRPLYAHKDELVAAQGDIPGVAPFTRGPAPVRRGLGWDIRTIHIDQNPAEVNKSIMEDLQAGVTSVALHIGGPGLAASKDALAQALDGVLLDVCPVVLIAEEAAFDAAAALNGVWSDRNIAASQRSGDFGADPLGTLARQGQLATPIDTALARAVALVKTALPTPNVRALCADGVAYHVAGASEAQELGIMLATLVAYLRASERGGIAPADALPKITVALAADADQFSTISKLRAARKLVWSVAEACGAGDAAAKVQFACPTSFRMMAKRDPWTNILRTTIACAGAALGGADAICVLPFTFALGKPDGFARRVARNIQIVCQEESHLGRVTDPAGGSWYVEQLTEEMAKKGWEIFQDIEARGGMLPGLTTGYIQELIEATAQTRAKLIATGRQELTGISAFPLLGDDGIHAEPWPKPAASSKGPAEIEVKQLSVHRLGEAFENLRDASDAKGGFKLFLASMGEIADHNIRTTWGKNYLAAGGIEALVSDGYKSPEAAAAAFSASPAKVACICSSDAIYADVAEATAQALKQAGASWVLLAGRPGDKEAALKAAGVDQFLTAGADAVATLKGLQDKLS